MGNPYIKKWNYLETKSSNLNTDKVEFRPKTIKHDNDEQLKILQNKMYNVDRNNYDYAANYTTIT